VRVLNPEADIAVLIYQSLSSVAITSEINFEIFAHVTNLYLYRSTAVSPNIFFSAQYITGLVINSNQ